MPQLLDYFIWRGAAFSHLIEQFADALGLHRKSAQVTTGGQQLSE
jgi:hypothetical protein